jgi:hypothetical protein
VLPIGSLLQARILAIRPSDNIRRLVGCHHNSIGFEEALIAFACGCFDQRQRVARGRSPQGDVGDRCLRMLWSKRSAAEEHA